MDDLWRQRIRFTCIGLGQLTVGASIMAFAISNAEHSIWSLPQFAFGGAIVTQGFIHLTAAWTIEDPANDPPPLGNGIARVGIPLAPNEQGVPDLVDEGIILHRNALPIAGRKNNFGEANLENEDEAEPAKVVGEARPANFAGEGQVDVEQEPVPEIVDEADPEIDDSDADPANALEEVGQANDVEESGQVSNGGELGQDQDESDQANEVDQSSDIDEANQAESVNDIAECTDKDDSTDVFDSEIELPRSFIGLALDVPSIKFIDSSESECESSS